MSWKQKIVFFKEWANYLKRGELSFIQVVLMHSPSSPAQLSFLIEIIAQLCMLHSYAKLNKPLSRPTPFPLANFAHNHQIISIFTSQYIHGIISLHQEMAVRLPQDHKQSLTSILVSVLVFFNNVQSGSIKGKKWQYLLSIGKLLFIQQRQQTLKNNTIMEEIKARWSVRQLIGSQWREDLVDLLIIWSATLNQAKFSDMTIEQQVPNLINIEEHSENLLSEWFDGVCHILTDPFTLAGLTENEEGLSQITRQVAGVVKTLRIKSHRAKKQILLQLKEKIFGSISSARAGNHQSLLFATHFTILGTLCLELDEKIISIITFDDLLSRESIFYSAYWQLSRIDCLRYFTHFSAYMRQNAQCPILSIYNKLNGVSLPQNYQPLSEVATIELIQKEEGNLLFQFNLQPINVSRRLLNYYLQKSGIPLCQRSSKARIGRRNIITPLVRDPLHFLMIINRFWESHYHRDILQIAVWVTLHCYCRWIELQSFRESSEKQTQEYTKKLKLAVCIFFFSLSQPTRFLQYQPVESDCFKELFMQSIFPSLILISKYFFHNYHWAKREIVEKMDGALENWVLPWGHLLVAPKNMIHFIYLDKGYQLAYTLASQNKPVFQKIYLDFFVTRIYSQLQGLGINLANGQAQIRQKLSFLHPERKKYMILLLKDCQKSVEKAGHTARRILQILI